MKARDDDDVGLDEEGDRDATLEADDSQAWMEIVAASAALRSDGESEAIRLEALNIAQRDYVARAFGDPIVQMLEVSLRLWREDDLPAFQTRAFFRARELLRISAKTFLAGMPRLGSALNAL